MRLYVGYIFALAFIVVAAKGAVSMWTPCDGFWFGARAVMGVVCISADQKFGCTYADSTPSGECRY